MERWWSDTGMETEVLEENLLIWITFTDPVRTAQYTHSVFVIQTDQLMLYREKIAVCCQIHTKHINTLWGQNV